MSGRKIGGWLNLVISGVLAFAVWGLATVLSTQPAFKVLGDFSPQARFTVEDATEELISDLRAGEHELEIHTLFFPLHTLPNNTPEQRQNLEILQRLQDLTRDLLRQYAYLGGDTVRVTHHDLMQEPGKVREVMRAVQNGRYNSVIVKLGTRSKVLSLEYDLAEIDQPGAGAPGMPGQQARVATLRDYKGEEALSTAIKRLLVEGVPKVYFLQGYGRTSLAGIGQSYSDMANALGEDGFETEFLSLADSAIPEDASIIALINPTRELLPADADKLMRFVRGGGRVLINLHYYADDLRSWNVGMRALGERLGFAIGEELVCHAVQDPARPNYWTSGTPMCQNLLAVNLNMTHPVTRPLAVQQRFPRFKAGREVRATDTAEEGVRVDTSFLRTGPQAWLEAHPVDYLAPAAQGAFGPRSIGAVIDVDPETGKRTGHVVLLTGEGLDNLSFQFNGDFVLNLFNWMAERDALISVRGQRYVSRQLELAPPQLDRIAWLLIAGVPGTMLMLGLGVFWRRRRT